MPDAGVASTETIAAGGASPRPSAPDPSPKPDASPKTELARNQTEVYAVHGADPEVLAYAMAKYSRSALSMKESLREISSQRAEQFLNTFYFQYGHRSIADLAHIAFAVERLSLLAAIVLVDEPRWDGQERSTRYQDFRKSGWYLPDFGPAQALSTQFTATIEDLFREYHRTSDSIFEVFRQSHPRPAQMKEEAYLRTLRARAFDVARYLLPLAANTSLGQIVNARTLEQQISRLLSDRHAEIRQLGDRLRDAASGAAWDLRTGELAAFAGELKSFDVELGERASSLLLREVKPAPTLVKYAAANEYVSKTRDELAAAASSLMGGVPPDAAPIVDLLEQEPLEVEIATTLLYGASHYPYRQLRNHVSALENRQLVEIIGLGAKHRGPHDEMMREFASGQALRFDILMDIGGFRDLHRHRRCIQIRQRFTNVHGYDVPDVLEEAGLRSHYEEAMGGAHEAFSTIAGGGCPDQAEYALPLGTRCRTLFKMDFSEALYISELRSAPAGHFSYRRVAWEMYQAVARRHPALAAHFRVTDIRQPEDFLRR